MPATAAGYVHRIGRTGRAYNTGQSVSIVCHFVDLLFSEWSYVFGLGDFLILKQ